MARPKGSTRLDDGRVNGGTLPVPAEASEKDRQRIQQVNRNIQIRRAYPDLRDEHGRNEAFRKLARRYNVEPPTVKAIVYEQR